MKNEIISDFKREFFNKFDSIFYEPEELNIWSNSDLKKDLALPKISKIDDDWRFPITFDDQTDEYWYGGTALFYGNLEWENPSLKTVLIPSMGESGQYEGGVIGLTLNKVTVSPWATKQIDGQIEKHFEYAFNFGGWEIPEILKSREFRAQFEQLVPDFYINEYGLNYQQIVKDVYPEKLSHPATLYIGEALSRALGYCVLLHGLRELTKNFNKINETILSMKDQLFSAHCEKIDKYLSNELMID